MNMIFGKNAYKRAIMYNDCDEQYDNVKTWNNEEFCFFEKKRDEESRCSDREWRMREDIQTSSGMFSSTAVLEYSNHFKTHVKLAIDKNTGVLFVYVSMVKR